MKISCLIPAYNEENRITNVLNIVTRHPLIDEVIVINDASTDKTRDAITAFKNILFLEHLTNKGKSNAIYTGLQRAQGDYVLFVDADLVGLNEEYITNLIEPVLNGKADVTISLRGNTPILWRVIGLDYISGERVLPRRVVMDHAQHIPTLPGFGLEVFLNTILIQEKCRIQVVAWDKVHSPYKRGGYGILKDIKGNIHMAREVLKNISLWGAFWQIKKMLELRVD
jgi:glycosyltransferase involved in cell wall biosynthesis